MPDVPINEFVLPVVEATPSEPYPRIERYRGTAFAIGQSGVIVTAAHVIDSPRAHLAVETPGKNGGSLLWSLQAMEKHPEEDVAVARVQFGAQTPYSPLRVSTEPQYGSATWMLWGYPEDAMYDVAGPVIKPHPELVYVEGYVRRRMPYNIELPAIRGRRLYECGGLAGRGCSGSPVISKKLSGENWPVIGVYIGERLDPERGLAVSFVVRLDDLADWKPKSLGRALRDASCV